MRRRPHVRLLASWGCVLGATGCVPLVPASERVEPELWMDSAELVEETAFAPGGGTVVGSGAGSISDSGPGSEKEPTAAGRGVFVHVVKGGGTALKDEEYWEFWARDTAVAGSQLSYSWATLEPEPGVYDWALVRKHMAPWTAYGKRVWIELQCIELPAWVLDEIVTVDGTVDLPIFWDDAYQERWLAFIDAFALEFDGDPGIEFVAIGGYSPSLEPRAYGTEEMVPGVLEAITAQGYDGLEPDGVWYSQAFVPLVERYEQAFTHTRRGQIITVSEPFSDTMLDLVGGEQQAILLSNGFSWKVATSEGRQEWRERAQAYETDVGYAEWGPAGVGDLAFDVLYEGAVGEGSDSSWLSYLPLADEQVHPGDDAAVEAVTWVDDHLRDWTP